MGAWGTHNRSYSSLNTSRQAANRETPRIRGISSPTILGGLRGAPHALLKPLDTYTGHRHCPCLQSQHCLWSAVGICPQEEHPCSLEAPPLNHLTSLLLPRTPRGSRKRPLAYSSSTAELPLLITTEFWLCTRIIWWETSVCGDRLDANVVLGHGLYFVLLNALTCEWPPYMYSCQISVANRVHSSFHWRLSWVSMADLRQRTDILCLLGLLPLFTFLLSLQLPTKLQMFTEPTRKHVRKYQSL